jgi:hypothetical protein
MWKQNVQVKMLVWLGSDISKAYRRIACDCHIKVRVLQKNVEE